MERELITKVKTGNSQEAKAILNELLGYVFFAGGNSLDMVKARSIELCSLLSRAAIEGGATSDTIFRINNQYLKSLQSMSLDAVARHVHLNPAYFSSLFKQSTGSSFKEYLNMVRVEESKRLLTNTNYSVIDIAIATGFEDQSYFSKVFKKYTGLTPKQYR